VRIALNLLLSAVDDPTARISAAASGLLYRWVGFLKSIAKRPQAFRNLLSGRPCGLIVLQL